MTDVVKQLKLDAAARKAPYGQIVDFAEVDRSASSSPGTAPPPASALPNGDAIPRPARA